MYLVYGIDTSYLRDANALETCTDYPLLVLRENTTSAISNINMTKVKMIGLLFQIRLSVSIGLVIKTIVSAILTWI